MSRIPALALVVFASAAVACGSSEPTSSSSGQRLFGDDNDKCKLDPSQCVPTQPPSPGGTCSDVSLTATACLGAHAWSQIAGAACAAQGTTLTSTTFSAACGVTNPIGQDGQPTDPSDKPGQPLPPDGNASYQTVKFTCCAAVPPPNPCIRMPIDKPQTGGTDPKGDAARVCDGKQLTLTGLEEGANGASVAICCPGPTPPPQPPPQACLSISVGDKVTCLSKQVLFDKAEAACAQRGLTMSNIAVTVPCQEANLDQTDGMARLAEVTCCAGAPTQPPPDANKDPQKH